MKQTLSDFICEWNQTHRRFIFSAAEAPMCDRPISVDIRYSAAKYQDFYSAKQWNSLTDLVEVKSHGTMYVTTDERLFERGIIEIKVASSNHNYEERLVIGVLRWIGEEFFPQPEISRTSHSEVSNCNESKNENNNNMRKWK